MSEEFEELLTPIPGPHSRELAESLQRLESRGVTYLASDFPVFWESAVGALVTDVDGNRFIDLTSAFGVATLGHTDPYVASAIADQAVRLIHGMGDVHPTEVRVRLLEALAGIVPAPLARTFLCSTGSEAVDFALKTAYLKTGKRGVIAFEGSYHGLSGSALSVTGIPRFRAPFAPFVREDDVTFVPYPRRSDGGDEGRLKAGLALRDVLASTPDVGALIVEPIQGRGGIILPPKGWLRELRKLCDEFEIVLIFDEIYTGFARTGTMFACEVDKVVPDLLVIGKAFGNGMPIAAVVGNLATMDAWEPSTGEALHTSTFLGNPISCAAALAHIGEIASKGIVERAASMGKHLGARLHRFDHLSKVKAVRGRGMLWGIELDSAQTANELVRAALQKGVILLQSGVEGNVITIAPPVIITEHQLYRALEILEKILARAVAA